ncbi:MAG: DUF937 domain-containing protein [Candidatus Aminicenantes bacterium]|nr:DUF937 domain-containing protein [Candidatus Aminicenantes bacterium]
MNLMEAILGGGGSPVSSMAKQFGLGEGEVTQAIQHMLPALTNGVKKNVSQQGGLESLLQALGQGNHDRYLDHADALSNPAAVKDGNGILGHIFGSKDTSRALAERTSKTTGISSGILKKMLPLIAAMVMGSLKKQSSNSGILDQLLGSLGGGRSSRSSSGGLGGLLGGLLGGKSSRSSSGGLGGVLGGLLGGGRKKKASKSPLDALGGLLDADGEGSAIDDILGMAKKMF